MIFQIFQKIYKLRKYPCLLLLSASYGASIIIGNVAVTILVDITQGPTYCPGFDPASPRLNYIVTCAWCNSFCILKSFFKFSGTHAGVVNIWCA